VTTIKTTTTTTTTTTFFWNGIEYSAFNAFNCKAVGDVRVKGLFAGSGEKVNIGVPY
jgi:hypothetical protein